MHGAFIADRDQHHHDGVTAGTADDHGRRFRTIETAGWRRLSLSNSLRSVRLTRPDAEPDVMDEAIVRFRVERFLESRGGALGWIVDSDHGAAFASALWVSGMRRAGSTVDSRLPFC